MRVQQRPRRSLLALLLALLFANPAAVWPGSTDGSPDISHLPALAGDYFPLASREVGRTFHVYVRLPPGYDARATARYPVVYVLDGDSLFPLLAASHLFIAMDDGLPEAVIVGIAYGSFDPAINRRDVDFATDGADSGRDGAVGAEAFARFLERELAPRIEASYAVEPARRILFGQSRGGGFVLYSSLRDPDFFWGRIASNPTLPANPGSATQQPGPWERRDLRLVVALGTADRRPHGAGAQAWVSNWQARKDAPWKLDTVIIEGGTHAANAGDAYRRGLRALFATAPWSVRQDSTTR